MKFTLSIGAVEAKDGDSRGFTFAGGDIVVEYTEQEFLTMTEKYPQVIAAVFDQLNAMSAGYADDTIKRAKNSKKEFEDSAKAVARANVNIYKETA